jgi:hypothetical protein
MMFFFFYGYVCRVVHLNAFQWNSNALSLIDNLILGNCLILIFRQLKHFGNQAHHEIEKKIRLTVFCSEILATKHSGNQDDHEIVKKIRLTVPKICWGEGF